MIKHLKRLQDQRAALAETMHNLVKDAEDADRGFTDEERGKWDTMKADYESLESRIAVAKEDVQRQADLEAPDNLPINNGDGQEPMKSRQKKDPESAYQNAFNALIRSQEPGMTGIDNEHRELLRSNERRDTGPQATTPGSAGGYLIPTTLVREIKETMKAFGGIRQYATVLSTSAGEEMQWPTNDDTGNEGALLAENTQADETEFQFAQLSLGAFKYTSKIVRVSIELLQDSAFNLDSFIARKFGERLGRITARHYATGTGTNQPQGLMTAATVGHTATSQTEVTYGDYLRLKHSIDPAYRQAGEGRWVMNDALLLQAKEMLDGNDRPLWKPGMADGTPALIDGDPYVIDQGVEAPASGTTCLGYGSLREFYIRDVAGMTLHRMVEKYIDYGQIGFLAFLRTDSNLMDASAFKTLQMAGARATGVELDKDSIGLEV